MTAPLIKNAFPDAAAPWQTSLKASITDADRLADQLSVDAEPLRRVIHRYPMRINPYYLSLISSPGDPLWRQAVPDPAEMAETKQLADPSCEATQSPVPNLIHRYPTRVLFLVSAHCAMYCRHCMRKRMVGAPWRVTAGAIDQGLAYIRSRKEIREVILSGGDPLMCNDNQLETLLKALRAISHVQVIRIHTRMPCTLPQRITGGLADRLSRFHPLFINVQFNHPGEITDQAARACARLADAGIGLGSQTVLLRGVNDDPHVMARLMEELLRIRVRPYYLHHPDPVRGTEHFRVSVRQGLDILRALRGRISGMAVPQYMIDLPDGGGKIPLLPPYEEKDGLITVKNHRGDTFVYPMDEPNG